MLLIMSDRKHNVNANLRNILESQGLFKASESVCEIVAPICSNQAKVLFVEPFYGGSHKQLVDTLMKYVPNGFLVSMSAKKWPWRARCSSLVLSTLIPEVTTEKILFCSSVVSLSELLGLRKDLNDLKKIVYFHENQLVYPIRAIKERDIQFAYNQITTCLSADLILFNSQYNLDTFLTNINEIVKLLPDYRPKGLKSKIEIKSKVLYYPIEFPLKSFNKNTDILHIVWPHRWEFDKDPLGFIEALLKLKNEGLIFQVSLIGETFTDTPDSLEEAKQKLNEEILHFGFVESKEKYFEVLRSAHVVVSTAKHEFFGVSTLEAVHCGCYPVLPNRLVYPEIYPNECLYNNEEELHSKLRRYCLSPVSAVKEREDLDIDLQKYSLDTLLPFYLEVLS